jgi:hypothetical protein
LFAATAWVVAALWTAWAALEVMKRTRWPNWTYRPANLAFDLLKDTYCAVLGLLILVWLVLIFAPLGRQRWVVVIVVFALGMTWAYFGPQGIRE